MNWFEFALMKGVYPVEKANRLTNGWETLEISGANTNSPYLSATFPKEIDENSIYLVSLSIEFSAENTVGNTVLSRSTHLIVADTSEFSENHTIYGTKTRIPITEFHFLDVSVDRGRLTMQAYNYDGSTPSYPSFTIKKMKIKKII